MGGWVNGWVGGWIPGPFLEPWNKPADQKPFIMAITLTVTLRSGHAHSGPRGVSSPAMETRFSHMTL